jgi:DNA-binding FadR family transcriptional regulator
MMPGGDGGDPVAAVANGNGARPIRRSSMRDQLDLELKRLIVTGALPVGAALPSEAQLGQTYGCSRPIVREALRELHQMGLVRRAENGRELLVQQLPLEKLSDSIQVYVEHSQIRFEELFEMLELIDPVTARLAAERGGPDLLASLRALNDPAILTLENIVDAEEEFHLRLAEASGNRLLTVLWKPIRDVLRGANEQVVPLMGDPALTGTRRAHDEIIRAIAAGDPAAAEEWSRRHCRAFRRGLSLLGKSAAEPIHPLQAHA